ncbi:response regulator [Butyrivibrio sp. CB08]|uniref:hybrid sensor histidine kinase/response regulator n=1 Tax=Butyrivibrio sp. CB08 TaxID=2364879 RepID=UPI000EA8ADB3|nr:response regulator [Butyrivibrio sp. CB08]RKM61298.1 response regulator [Butyrivibrio sp. CB08]
MQDIRRERLILSVVTVAYLACSVQNYIGGWEFWVPPLCFGVTVALWWVHIAQKSSFNGRIYMYFAFSAFLCFYHGMQKTSLYDVAVAFMLFLATFTSLDRLLMLNLILIEFFLVMAIQFAFLYKDEEVNMTAFTIVKIIFHIGSFFTLYMFSRLTISRRLIERDKVQKWRDTVKENENDMQDFLSNISHEFRTPVNVISGMTALLKKSEDRTELDSIEEAGVHLAHLIEDIQDYTELKRGELVLEESEYMCSSLINDVVANYRRMNNAKNLEFIVDLSPKTPSVLKGDVQKIHKLFRHLIDNAVKFTRKGGIYIKVFPVKKEYGINLTIEITDTGVGMTRAAMAKVAGGMYQANKKRNRSTGGIGIGLPIVYGIVHKMGGFVKIDSTKGHGTTVRLSIPQQVVDNTPCMSVKEGMAKDVVFYSRPEKYAVPELRDFNSSMAIDLAKGLKMRLYSAHDPRELQRLLDDLDVTHIFMGQEEYEKDSEFFDKLAKEGYTVAVSSDIDFSVSKGSRVIMMPKPLYGYPIVRLINGEYEDANDSEALGKVRFEGVRALIVDDEPMNLVVAEGLFKEYGMVTDTAESGKEAIEKYVLGNYDVIFMDHMMPEMDGVEAMKRLRLIAKDSDRNVIIVALTANALSGAKEMFIQEGFDGFIAKPVDIGQFERVMKRLLPADRISYEGRVLA